MSLLRRESMRDQNRTFGFRGFHTGMSRIVNVHSCNFDTLSGEAIVSLPEAKKKFTAKMRDLILLEDTSRIDMHGTPIYEGDLVEASVQNEFGSWEVLEGSVLFDEKKWGFSVEFSKNWDMEFSGQVMDVRVVGNVFDQSYYEQTVSREEEAVGVIERI